MNGSRWFGRFLTGGFTAALVTVGLPGAVAGGTPPRSAILTAANPAVAAALISSDVTAPSGAAIGGGVAAQAVSPSRKVSVAWSATDAGSGVQSYDVRWRTANFDGSVGGYIALANATDAHSASYVAPTGTTVCFSVRARDRANNVSSWSVDRCTAIPLDDASLATRGFVRRTNVGGAFRGTVSAARQTGAVLAHPHLRARALTLIARTCPTCGAVTARWNGRAFKAISLAGPSATRTFTLTTFPKPATGTLQLVTTSARPVAVDAVGIGNPPLTGSITIAAGASYTKSTAVTVRASVLGASGSVRMRLANGTTVGGPWKTFAASSTVTLTPTDGVRPVAAQFVDAHGNTSTVALDDLTLDRVAPQVAATDADLTVTAGANATVHATVVDTSPLSTMELRTAPLGSSTFSIHPMTAITDHFAATIPAPGASFAYTVVATDAAGNIGSAPATAPLDAFRVTVQGPPSSQQLIGDALNTGTIDYPTALEYRVWSLFSDPQLPDAYVGGGSAGEDSSLFLELQDAFAGLAPAAQAKIAPYLLRPNNPASPLTPHATTTASLAARTASASPATATCPAGLSTDVGTHFKVWSCGASDPDRATVLSKLEALYAPMTAAEPGGLGTPISDATATDNGGDGLVDVYLVDAAQCWNRGGSCVPIPGTSVAAAVPTAPFASSGSRTTAAGYLLVNRARVGLPTIDADLAHEFFHVLQFAHNLKAMGLVTSGVANKSWFGEASATWAEWEYARNSAKAELYNDRYSSGFQGDDKSLVTFDSVADGGHQYSSWVWPLFMEQTKGASAVFQAFVGAESAANPIVFDGAIDAQWSFATHLREFAVRNLNEELTGHPYTLWKEGANASDFPTDIPHHTTNTDDLSGKLQKFPAHIDVLAAQYDSFGVDDKLDKVTFDFSPLTNVGNLDVDVVGRLKGKDEWKHIVGSGSKFEFCKTKPDENFDYIRVVLTNHARDRVAGTSTPNPAKAITGNYEVTSGLCSTITGAISYSYNYSGIDPGQGLPETHTEHGDFNFAFGPADPPDPGFFVDSAGGDYSATVHQTLETPPDATCHHLFTTDESPSGAFVWPPQGEFDSVALFDGHDPSNPFVHGDLAALTPLVQFHASQLEVSDGPVDPCGPSFTNTTTSDDNLLRSVQCIPPAAQAQPFGPLPFYGVYGELDGKRFFDFDCSQDITYLGMPGHITVTGKLYLVDAGS